MFIPPPRIRLPITWGPKMFSRPIWHEQYLNPRSDWLNYIVKLRPEGEIILEKKAAAAAGVFLPPGHTLRLARRIPYWIRNEGKKTGIPKDDKLLHLFPYPVRHSRVVSVDKRTKSDTQRFWWYRSLIARRRRDIDLPWVWDGLFISSVRPEINWTLKFESALVM